jgi:hypothetical protein
MAVLTEIAVTIADLKVVRPDILNFQYDTESDSFAEEINRAKSILYRQVKDNERLNQPSLTEAELTALLLLVKDISDVEYLKERLVLLTIAEIFKANDMFETSSIYERDSNNVELIYYVDANDDGIIEISEERKIQRVSFGR